MVSKGGDNMEIEISIDSKYKIPKIIIKTEKITDEITQVMQKLSEDSPKVITGFKDERAEILEPKDIYRFYSSQGKVFAVTERGEYTVRVRLYEIEEQMRLKDFVRVSNSEIINLKKVSNFDLSFAGTICVKFTDGTDTYVSRRYVSKIKKILGV